MDDDFKFKPVDRQLLDNAVNALKTPIEDLYPHAIPDLGSILVDVDALLCTWAAHVAKHPNSISNQDRNYIKRILVRHVSWQLQATECLRDPGVRLDQDTEDRNMLPGFMD